MAPSLLLLLFSWWLPSAIYSSIEGNFAIVVDVASFVVVFT
jgi:hypothetical protein